MLKIIVNLRCDPGDPRRSAWLAWHPRPPDQPDLTGIIPGAKPGIYTPVPTRWFLRALTFVMPTS